MWIANVLQTIIFHLHKDIFACLFSIHNKISLSCHEQVSLSGLKLIVHEKYQNQRKVVQTSN